MQCPAPESLPAEQPASLYIGSGLPGHLKELDAQLLPSGRAIVARSANQTPSAASLTICVAHVAIGCAVPPLEAGLESADPQYARIGVGQPAGRRRPRPELDSLMLRSPIVIASHFDGSYLTGIMRCA